MEQVRYKNFNPDNLLILGTIAKVLKENNPIFSDEETLILHAIKRSNNTFRDLNSSEIGEVLSEYDENQMLGFVNNVKGILHELQFVEIENADGDSITASIFPDTNHKGIDIMLTNDETGEIIDVQLKATDSVSYINDWIEQYPNGDILVTEEVAEKMGLETTGISNEKLTTDVNSFVDKIINSSDKDDFWEYLPFLPTISIAIAGVFLYNRYKSKEIDWKTFKQKFIKMTGLKIAKFGIISVLMIIPIVNIVAGATVLYLAINSTKKCFINK